MPYPVVHVLFFILCISAVAVYAIVSSFSRGELSFKSSKHLLWLLLVGSICSLFPDVMVIHSLIVDGTMEHCWAGPIPTHSLLFSLPAVLFGIAAGYVIYRESARAMYLGVLAEAAFASHLLLDDISEDGCEYLYPLYVKKISVFSMMDISFRETGLFHYLMTSFLSVFLICSVIMMVLFTLSKYGFKLKYEPEK